LPKTDRGGVDAHHAEVAVHRIGGGAGDGRVVVELAEVHVAALEREVRIELVAAEELQAGRALVDRRGAREPLVAERAIDLAAAKMLLARAQRRAAIPAVYAGCLRRRSPDRSSEGAGNCCN
jgi:hypothetical protein